MPYSDASSQTIIAGLTKHPSPIPPPLILTNTPTPPDDFPPKATTMDIRSTPSQDTQHSRPRLKARLSLPPPFPDPTSEDPRSPPPTEAMLSPLPEANRLHAGHTPLIPMALSPLPKAPNGELTPDEPSEPIPLPPEMIPREMSPEEVILSGPLTLPPVPADGADDQIELKALDAVLEKVAKERSRGSSPVDEREDVDAMDVNMVDVVATTLSPLSRKRSSRCGIESARRGSEQDVEVVDGVILKRPKLNFGAPLGQV